MGTPRVLDFVTALWLGLIGACVGSFLNVVAYRMPRGMSVVWKPSHCPRCGHAIRARDNVPVLGWLLLRGRCRDCGGAISPRYAIVEAAMGLAFFALAYVELFSGGANLPGRPAVEATGALHLVWNPSWPVIRLYAYHGLLLSLLMAMALVDEDRQRIPRSLVLAALAVAALASWRWWDMYPERTRTVRVKEWKAPLDALLGMAWAAVPLATVAAIVRRRRHAAAADAFVRLAIGFGTIGAFLGLRAVVRTAVIWIGCLLIARLLPAPMNKLGKLTCLWAATLVQISFWKQLAAWVSW
jgi:leader peptidase (prepilin peptidase)/N-methyltransferase